MSLFTEALTVAAHANLSVFLICAGALCLGAGSLEASFLAQRCGVLGEHLCSMLAGTTGCCAR